MLMPTESAFNLIPVFGWPGFIPYHSRKRTRQPRGSTRPSVSKSSCTIAHHPTENGEAEPQSHGTKAHPFLRHLERPNDMPSAVPTIKERAQGDRPVAIKPRRHKLFAAGSP